VILLFDIYHRFIDDFDNLINDQVEWGDTPCPVKFAKNAIAMLTERGFETERVLKIFGIFYQLRRAFFFIDRGLVGQSSSMMTLRMHLWNSVFTQDVRWYDKFLCERMEDFSTLLLGETGTGKGAAAAAIGRSGYIPFDPKTGSFTESFTRNFISINLSQYPESLIESELFGHRKGSFTGAVDDHEGILGRCTPHGAIFLDEIGDISVPVQIKLLQVLQERTFSPVGSHVKKRFHGRVIAATNKPISQLRHEKKFRDDIFYRLCTYIISVPSLRQRIKEERNELDILLTFLVGRIVGTAEERIVSMVRELLDRDLEKNYEWPGNVRELEQAVRRIFLTRHYHGDLEGHSTNFKEDFLKSVADGALDAATLLQQYCHMLYKKYATYEEVSRRTGLDRRTVKKYVLAATVPD
jgi:transcriptional regulator with PAS, ATPase and Fis domain